MFARIKCVANVLALQRMLGHKSAKVTLDTYSDLFDDDLDAVAACRPAWRRVKFRYPFDE
jgi:hypothetical protein